MDQEFSSEVVKAKQEIQPTTTARAWVELPEKLEKARKLGYDENKITLGYALDHITGDDANAFTPLLTGFHKFNLEIAQAGKEMILARMEWETGIEQLPIEFRIRIREVRNKLEISDWKTEAGFKAAYEIWRGEIMDYFSKHQKLNPELAEARKLYLTMEERITSQNLAATPTKSFLK